jgi:hypothetical protein
MVMSIPMVPGGTLMVVAPPASYSHSTVSPRAGMTDSHAGFACAVPWTATTASHPIATAGSARRAMVRSIR